MFVYSLLQKLSSYFQLETSDLLPFSILKYQNGYNGIIWQDFVSQIQLFPPFRCFFFPVSLIHLCVIGPESGW